MVLDKGWLKFYRANSNNTRGTFLDSFAIKVCVWISAERTLSGVSVGIRVSVLFVLKGERVLGNAASLFSHLLSCRPSVFLSVRFTSREVRTVMHSCSSPLLTLAWRDALLGYQMMEISVGRILGRRLSIMG